MFKGRLGRRIPLNGRRVSNFGDLLGPVVVQEVLASRGIRQEDAPRQRRLVSIGSVMHLAQEGDVVWGTGINGKHLDEDYGFGSVDFRAVRGPLTRERLVADGQRVPEVFGDPGLLVGTLWPHLRNRSRRYPLTVIPNLNDWKDYAGKDDVMDPRAPLRECITRISQSEFVIGSSLHGVIVAEALGIPARLMSSGVEPAFKYEDYYLGSGRSGFKAARSISQALEMGGEEAVAWDPDPLLKAFPVDLWSDFDGVHS